MRRFAEADNHQDVQWAPVGGYKATRTVSDSTSVQHHPSRFHDAEVGGGLLHVELTLSWYHTAGVNDLKRAANFAMDRALEFD